MPGECYVQSFLLQTLLWQWLHLHAADDLIKLLYSGLFKCKNATSSPNDKIRCPSELYFVLFIQTTPDMFMQVMKVKMYLDFLVGTLISSDIFILLIWFGFSRSAWKAGYTWQPALQRTELTHAIANSVWCHNWQKPLVQSLRFWALSLSDGMSGSWIMSLLCVSISGLVC